MKSFFIGLILVVAAFSQAKAQTDNCCVKCPEGCCWVICDAEGNITGYSVEKPEQATLASSKTDAEVQKKGTLNCSAKDMSQCSKMIQTKCAASNCCTKSATTSAVAAQIEPTLQVSALEDVSAKKE